MVDSRDADRISIQARWPSAAAAPELVQEPVGAAGSWNRLPASRAALVPDEAIPRFDVPVDSRPRLHDIGLAAGAVVSRVDGEDARRGRMNVAVGHGSIPWTLSGTAARSGIDDRKMQ